MPKVSLLRHAVPVLLALAAVRCGVDLPPTTPTQTPARGTPAHIELSATPGTGANGGTARLQARVQDAFAATVPDVVVTFAASAGNLETATVTTDANGIAVSVLTAEPGVVKVAAAAGSVTAPEVTFTVQPHTDPFVPPSGPPPPPPPVGPPNVPFGITVSAVPAAAGTATTFGMSVTGGSQVVTSVWTFGDSTAPLITVAPSAAIASHVYASPATYPVSVTSTDSRGRTASAATTVVVPAAPVPTPAYTVTLAAAPTTVDAGTSSTLTATVTLQNGATAPTTFKWDCTADGTDDQTTAGNTAVCDYTASGSITARVTASNGTTTGTATTAITVRPVVVTVDCGTPAAGVSAPCSLVVRINGVNVASEVSSVVWKWGDGTPDSTTSAGVVATTHTFPQPGSFAVDVTVTLAAPHAGATGAGTATVPVH